MAQCRFHYTNRGCADPGFLRRRVRLLLDDFLKQFLEDISPLCGATDTPVLDFWRRLPWVSKSEWAALFALGGGVRDISPLKFTSAYC